MPSQVNWIKVLAIGPSIYLSFWNLYRWYWCTVNVIDWNMKRKKKAFPIRGFSQYRGSVLVKINVGLQSQHTKTRTSYLMKSRHGSDHQVMGLICVLWTPFTFLSLQFHFLLRTGSFFVVGEGLVHCRIFRSIPGLYPLGTSSILPSLPIFVTIKNVSRCYQYPMGDRIPAGC